MSQSDRAFMRIGCPRCEATVDATVPPGPGIEDPTGDAKRLRGREANCQQCGHELEVYFY